MQAPESTPNKRRGLQVLGSVVGHSLKLGVALALGLAAWEAILGAWVFRPAPFRQDPNFGWMPKPHAVAFTNIEGNAAAFYNERGFRDEPITPRQPGELRVLCLGDSFVEALDVPQAQTFETRLQDMLSKYLQQRNRDDLPRRARVFNAGRAGTSVAGVLHFAPEYKKLFDPDVVIVMVHDEWKVPFDRTQEVRLMPQGEGGSEGFRVQMFNHSESSGALFRRLVQLGVRDMSIATHGSRQLRLMRTKGADPEAGAEASDAPQAQAPQADTPGAGEKSDSRRSDTPVGKSQDAPIPLTPAAQAAAMMVRAAAWTPAQLKSAYPQLVVVSVPQTSVRLHGLVPVSETERAFLQNCRAQNLRTVDMRPAIESDFARSQTPPFGFPTTLPWVGHFNAHGHDLIARTLFENLLPQVLEATKP